MLLKLSTLEGIRDGRITCAFRRWKRPTVKAGGTLKTRLGELEIVAVEPTSLSAISAADAHAAGCASRKDLLDLLATRDGELARITFGRLRADPRIELRNDAALTEADVATLRKKLDGHDARSAHGPWTRATLRCLADRPRVSARTLSADLGFERLWWKGNVRKLKALGLTISHSPGYELSPRGRALLERLGDG